ncbi:MAG: protein kinase domain-containing protein [Prochlorothrix sp.]
MLLDNRYNILESLGAGGFGEAFLAEDTQMPSRRRCVIKKLHPQSQDPQVFALIRDRFQREAATLEDLGKHDQIPTLYAYFEEQGHFYLSQELIEGETLTRYMQQYGPQSEAFVRDLLRNLLEVLQFVHSKKIIHRDLNPNNIMVRARDRKPVLIDFGAVKELMSSTFSTAGGVTPSIVIGTPGFMSSEQAAGRPVFSSDLYAVALTAIYMLTGYLPQDLETDYNTGEVLWSHQCPQISPTLTAILKRAIDPNPTQRYSNASQFQAALLQGMVDPQPLDSPPPLDPTTGPPQGGSAQKTVMSPAPTATVKTRAVAAPPASTQGTTQGTTQGSYTAPPPSPPAPKGGDSLKTLVIAASIVGSVLTGFWMLSQSNAPDSVSSGPTASPTPEAPAADPTPPPPDPTPEATPTPTPTPTPPDPTPAPTPTPSTIESAGQSSSEANPYQAQVDAQLEAARLALGLGDYGLSHDNYTSALEGGMTETLTLDLDQGQTYSIVAACDEDCSDLDLVLYDDNGNEIDTDTGTDDFPIVEVAPAWNATFSLEVQMYNCSATTCVYGVGVFSKAAP